MWVRTGVITSVTLLALLLSCLTALAGGFAVTTLDELPHQMRANATYRIGYTIRQHGVTPVTSASTRIVAQFSTTGATLAFVGAPEGAPGHYVADVTFPEEGTWQWQVEQGPFAPQQLGMISVASASVPAELATPGIWIMDLTFARVALPAATLLSGLVFLRYALRPSRARRAPIPEAGGVR
jgi:hypothetical protein